MTHNRPILSRYWLFLGVAALAVAGLFSLVLVVARAPSLAQLPVFSGLFHKALVVHVDLSVLVWFLSMACLTWSLAAARARPVLPYLEEAALIAFALGALAVSASPLDPKGAALMSNYIPVITSPLFFLGLGLLLSGVLLMLVKIFLPLPEGEGISRLACFSSALIAAIAVAAFYGSYLQMPRGVSGQHYYELLFWGGGHVLQFLHVQIMMLCWLMLVSGIRKTSDTRYLIPAFLISPLAALATPVPYLLYPLDSPEHLDFFTEMMIWGGGIAPVALALYLIPVLWRRVRQRNALSSALITSVALFLYGGALGGLIQGQNVVIPAHYHGSIVGVTLAFMGAAYLLLPRFGYRDVGGWRMAFWQPIVYGGGQFLHISGLAWSGGYGVLRKTPGGLEALPFDAKAAMGMMGLGGLIAIIGGFMFVIVVGRSVLSSPHRRG